MSDLTTAQTKIWLVEDNDIFSAGVQRAISRDEGMVCSGNYVMVEDAIDAMEQGTLPDVILLDVQLPGMDGITALSQLKTLSPMVQVIILTAFDDADKIFRAICAGASGYILKSSQGSEIREAIRQVIAGGAPMTPEVARKVLDTFAAAATKSANSNDYDITPRQCDILRLMADGLVQKEIADSLSISVYTVSTHIQRVYKKLHVTNNAGAVAKALREKLI